MEPHKPKKMLIVIDGNWFYNAIVLGQNTSGIDPIRHVLGRGWEDSHRIDYRRLVNEIEAHILRFQPSAKSFRCVAFFCSPPNVPLPTNRVRMFEDMASCGIEVYHVPNNPVAMATELVSSVSTYEIACVVSGDRSITYSMGHIREKSKLVGLVTLRGAFNESDYTNIDFPVFWLEDRVDNYVSSYPFYMRLKPSPSPLTQPYDSSSLIAERLPSDESVLDRVTNSFHGQDSAVSSGENTGQLNIIGNITELPLNLSRHCSETPPGFNEFPPQTSTETPPHTPPYMPGDSMDSSVGNSDELRSRYKGSADSRSSSNDQSVYTEAMAVAFIVKCLQESPYPNVQYIYFCMCDYSLICIIIL